MSWQDDIYINHPLGRHTIEFCTIPPCDYMSPTEDVLDRKWHLMNPRRKREQVREQIWEHLNS